MSINKFGLEIELYSDTNRETVEKIFKKRYLVIDDASLLPSVVNKNYGHEIIHAKPISIKKNRQEIDRIFTLLSNPKMDVKFRKGDVKKVYLPKDYNRCRCSSCLSNFTEKRSGCIEEEISDDMRDTGLHIHFGPSASWKKNPSILNILKFIQILNKEEDELRRLGKRNSQTWASSIKSLHDKINSAIVDNDSYLLGVDDFNYKDYQGARFVNILHDYDFCTIEFRYASGTIMEDKNDFLEYFDKCKSMLDTAFDKSHQKRISWNDEYDLQLLEVRKTDYECYTWTLSVIDRKTNTELKKLKILYGD